jgi:tRNA pseudouridine38-40 synthase
VISAGWQQQADEWTFEIRADAFLYRMVRRLVYAQVAVGQNRLPAETLLQALDDPSEVGQAARRQIPASLAPASGLTLVEVRYDNLV